MVILGSVSEILCYLHLSRQFQVLCDITQDCPDDIQVFFCSKYLDVVEEFEMWIQVRPITLPYTPRPCPVSLTLNTIRVSFVHSFFNIKPKIRKRKNNSFLRYLSPKPK
ncbi:hypothetical protein NL108_014131 [Boleophthalmus pectinirostris]|nr:hypothetical protein NL108_014131 [Boleophthalmus pectinirostris]